MASTAHKDRQERPVRAAGLHPAKVQYVIGQSYDLPIATVTDMQAPCPVGTTVIGGGFYVSIATVSASESYGAGWAVIVDNNSGIDLSGTPYALCAAP
jgi:hypothetical protein